MVPVTGRLWTSLVQQFPGQPVGSQGPFQWPRVRRGVHSGSLAPLQPDIFHCHNSSRTSVATPMKRLVDAFSVVVWLADDRLRHSEKVNKIVG